MIAKNETQTISATTGRRHIRGWYSTVAIQAAFLVGLTILMIQPNAVPDPLRVGDAMSWTLFCLVAGLPVLIDGARRQLPPTRLDGFLWIYAACSVAVVPFSHDWVVSGTWILALAGNIAIFYAVVSAMRVSESVLATVLMATVVGIAVLQMIALEYHLERGLTELIRAYERPAGWSGYPELGLLACVQLAVLLAVSQVTGRPTQLAVLALIAVTVLELTFLYSRMAWAAALVLFVVAPLSARTRGLRWQWGLALAIAAIAIVFAIGQTETGRMLRVRVTEPSAVAGRVEIWGRTAQLIQDHPLTGVGVGNFQAVYEPIYNPRLNSDERRGGHAHNLWLQVAAEQGLITAVAYGALWIAVLFFAWQQRLGSWVQRAALLIVVVIAVRSLGDYMFFSTGGAPARLHTLMWMAFGIVGAGAVPVAKHR